MRVNERKPIQNTHIHLGVSDENKKKSTQWFGLGFITRHIITQDSNIGIVDTYALAVNVGQFSVTESVHENFCLRPSTCLLSIRFFCTCFFLFIENEQRETKWRNTKRPVFLVGLSALFVSRTHCAKVNKTECGKSRCSIQSFGTHTKKNQMRIFFLPEQSIAGVS